MLGVIVMPSIAIHQDHHYPAIRGFFAQKNIAGRVFLLGVIFGLVLAKQVPERRTLGMIATGLCTIGMLASLSATALLDFVVVLIVFVASLIWKRLDKPSALVAGGIFTLAVLAIGYALYDHLFVELTEATGRDVTLTGRTLIWAELYSQVQSRSPLLGFGYEAFWTSVNSGAAAIKWVGLGPYIPPQAHNGLIHAYTGMGILGALAFLLTLYRLLSRALHHLKRGKNHLLGILSITFFAYFFVVNIAENEFLTYNSLIWCVFVLLLVLTSKGNAAREAK